MASLLERVQNVFDDHQDRERAKVRQESYQQALFEARDAMLGASIAIKDEWTRELAQSRSDSYGSIHAK